MSEMEFKQTLDKAGRPIITGDEQIAYVNGCWDTLKNGITDILSSNDRTNLSFNLLYTNAYMMIRHLFGGMLYNNLIETVTGHLRTKVRPIIETATDGNFIDELIKCYDTYTIALIEIGNLVLYMDETYVRMRKLEPVKELGLRLFREEIVNFAPIKEKLKNTVEILRRKEPEGTIFKQIFDMLIVLGVEKDFETALVLYVE